MLATVKTLTLREFYHSPSLAKSLHPGQSLIVTSQGKTELIVTKASPRPQKSAKQWQDEARKLLSGKKARKPVDTVEVLRSLRK